MSQAKVDKYKQEKYSRKHPEKKNNLKRVIKYIASTVVVVLILAYIGYSALLGLGVITPDVATTTQEPWSKAQVESLRNALIEKNDTNVKGNKSVPTAKTTPVTTKAAKKTAK